MYYDEFELEHPKGRHMFQKIRALVVGYDSRYPNIVVGNGKGFDQTALICSLTRGLAVPYRCRASLLYLSQQRHDIGCRIVNATLSRHDDSTPFRCHVPAGSYSQSSQNDVVSTTVRRNQKTFLRRCVPTGKKS